MKFKSESEMVNVFQDFIKSKISSAVQFDIYNEVKTPFGIPDLVLFEKREDTLTHIFAFELKLNKWRKALSQAFKYKSFSNVAFVILDSYCIKPAFNHLSLFISANICLASIDNQGNFMIYNAPTIDKPFSLNIKNEFLNFFNYQLYEDVESINSVFYDYVSNYSLPSTCKE